MGGEWRARVVGWISEAQLRMWKLVGSRGTMETEGRKLVLIKYLLWVNMRDIFEPEKMKL